MTHSPTTPSPDALRQALSYLTPHALTKGPVVLQADELRQAVETISAALATVADEPGDAVEGEVDALWDAIHQMAIEAYNLLDSTANSNPPEVDQEDWDALSQAMTSLGALIPKSEQPASPSYAVPFLRSMLTPAPKANGVGTGEEGNIDPGRVLKDALFACLKAVGTEHTYGGVMVAQDRFAWVRFTIEPPRADGVMSTAAPRANGVGTGEEGWRPIGLFPPRTKALFGRWTMYGTAGQPDEHWNWEEATGTYHDYEGERFWNLDGRSFGGYPFYNKAPTHAWALPTVPPDRPGASSQTKPPALAAKPEGEKVTLDYTNYRGERAIRTITPWGVEWGTTDWHPEPGWLLACYDHDKHACRTYALSGIHSWNGVVVQKPEGEKASAGEDTTTFTDLSVTCDFCVSIAGRRDPNRYCSACNKRPALTTTTGSGAALVDEEAGRG